MESSNTIVPGARIDAGEVEERSAGEVGPLFKPLRRDDLTIEELDGEAILYDPRHGAVHRFNASTLFIWKACDGIQSTEEIAGALAEACSIETDAARATVNQVVEDLKARDLLRDDPSEQTDVPEAGNRGRGAQSSRRELLTGGVTKLVFVVPVITTFIAVGLYANGPGASAAFGGGGCKLPGDSCVANTDCCGGPDDALCGDQTAGICCAKNDRLDPACVRDTDCCEYPTKTCIAGKCN